ncbi:hypothetical protein EV424DRAFT_1424661 [Suillus variegatus]|nr:hypothetical protein EV424DRAFT_1424661 [Suillus variegatus]
MGKPDTLSLLPSAFDSNTRLKDVSISPSKFNQPLPPLPPDTPEYLKADIPFDSEMPGLNYSIPIEIEHTLIWSRVPIFHPDLIPPEVDTRIQQVGLCGFTGNDELPPSPGITMDKLVCSPRGSPEIEEMVRNAGREIDGFVKRRWRLQSVRELAHIHVFAKKKEYL